MSSSLLGVNDNAVDVATPFSDAAVRSFDTDATERQRLQEKRQSALAHALEKKSELLASPDKIDSLVAGSLEDVFPLAKKPKAIGYSHVQGIDEELHKADHPMAGIGQTVKDKFKAALQNKDMAMTSPVEILDAVKKDTLGQKGEGGKSLLEKAYEYKMDKDQGGLFSFHPSKFIPGMTPYEDKNTVALPGYEEYKQKHEKSYTSIPEAVALGAATALVGAGVTALTGGAAAPGVAAILSRMAIAGAVAVPEFKAFDAAANAIKSSDFGQSDDTTPLAKLGAEMALGVVAAGVLHKGLKFTAGTALTKAIEAGKLSENAVATLKQTGLAKDAITAFETRTMAAKELAKTQSILDDATKIVERNRQKAARTDEVLKAAGKPEDMSVAEYINGLVDTHAEPFIRPQYAEVMGMTDFTLENAKKNPASLFTVITDPEIEASIMEDIKNGMSAQEATLKGFNQEASMKLAEKGVSVDQLFKEEGSFVYPGAEHLGYTIGETKVAKGSGRAVKAAPLDLGNAAPMQSIVEATPEELNTHLGYTLGGKPSKGVSVKGEVNLANDKLTVAEAVDPYAVRESKTVTGGNVNGDVNLTNQKTVTDPYGVAPSKAVKGGNTDGPVNLVNEQEKVATINNDVMLVPREAGKPAKGASVPGVVNLDNGFVNTTVKTEKSGKVVQVSNSANVVALAGAGVLAGGMALFGMPERSEAGVIGEVGKVASEAGKALKLLDGGLEVAGELVHKVAGKFSSPELTSAVRKVTNTEWQPVKSPKLVSDLLDALEAKPAAERKQWKNTIDSLYKDRLEPLDAKRILADKAITSKLDPRLLQQWSELSDIAQSSYDKVKSADVVTALMKAHDYRDVPGVLKSMEEMGIDTSTRIAYHGTPYAESTLHGYNPENARAGLYNDEGEFAKYFSHDPTVSVGYSGTEPKFGFKTFGAASELHPLVKAAAKEKGYTKQFFQDLDYLSDKELINTANELGIDTSKFTMTTQPNIQKSLLVVKKTYPMEGQTPEDVKALIAEYSPHLSSYARATDGTSAWKTLSEVAEVRAKKIMRSKVDELQSLYKFAVNRNAHIEVQMTSLKRGIIHTSPEYLKSLGISEVAAKQHIDELAEFISESANGVNNTPKTAANNMLRELGYDSITHLGHGDGFVTIALKQGVEQPFFTGKNLADITLKGVATAAVSIPLLSLLSPSDAEASTASLAGKVVNEVVAKTLMQETGGDLKNVFKVLLERRLVSERVAPGTTSLPVMQRQFEQAPKLGKSVGGFNEIVGRTKTAFDGFARFMSTNFFTQVYGVTNRGVAVQLASMQNAMTNNILNATDVAGYIIKNVRGIKPEHSKEIAEFMKPVQAAYDEVAIPMRGAELQIAAESQVIDNIKAALKDGKYTPEDAEALTKERHENITKLQKMWHDAQPKFASVDAQYAAAKEELIQKYPSARISFAVEEPGLMKKYASLYTVDERAAVAQFQEFYGHYKGRAQEVGLETISGPYINHSRDASIQKDAFAARLEEYGVQVSRKIPLTEFHSRSKYSKQMIPDISRNAFEYIPDTERRIQGADFWRVGRQDGWHAFSQNELIRSNKVWSEYFDRIKQGMIPPPATTLNKWADRYAAVETLRLLAFLPSAPFKHLFKNEGTWATLGFTHSMKMIPDAVMTSARNTANDVLRAQGLTEKMLPKGALDDFANSMIKQRSMVNPLSDLERPEGIVQGVDKWLNQLNNAGGVGIRAVEAFDRTHTIQAALDMALKKGMTAEQAMYGIYDTILKNNFLGGSLNPSWMHNPKIRALALFQNTPFKILERRLVNAYKTGQDVKTTWGIIKGQKLEETLGQLTDLKAFIQSGQNEFKKNMIYDALTSTKDAMGNSVTHQFMKEFLITGAILGAGSATGVDFSGHSFHIPFLKSGTHEPVLATSPIVDASWKTVTGKPSPGHENDEDKEFFTSRFLRHWLGSSGGAQPLLLHKFQRITADDIPAIYKDSPLRYLFSVPGKETTMN